MENSVERYKRIERVLFYKKKKTKFLCRIQIRYERKIHFLKKKKKNKRH